MKLLKLEINGYKNLKEKAIFDFSKCTNYAALIGLNGSGKSNTLEAISLIFSNLYNEKKCSFKYKINYELNEANVVVKDGILEVYGTEIPKKDYSLYLPTNIIASYSGEELRMWEEIYFESYSEFFQDIKKQTGYTPNLHYINKYCWDISLIALLCSDNPLIKIFINDTLHLPEDVYLKFDIKQDNYPLYEGNAALSLIRRIVELQEASPTGNIHINEIRTIDIGQKDNNDLTLKLFFYFFITGMPENKGGKIKADKIIRGIDIEFNDLNLKKISEGEKKLILIYTITILLSKKESLILLDEPDAHLHINRKKEIISIIEKITGFALFTTHSPTLLRIIPERNLCLVNNISNNLETILIDKIKSLETLTNGEFTMIDATLAFATTKDILLVEGTNDYKYFTKAIEVLKRTMKPKYNNFDITIINCGGAGNVAAVLKQIIIPYIKPNQLCIATFDNDDAGNNGIKSVNKVLIETPSLNVKTMLHPKITGWPATNEFFTEDYFPISAYKPAFEAKVATAATFKSLSSLQNPKGIIEDTYETFADQAFDNFELLLDEIIKLQNNFRPQ